MHVSMHTYTNNTTGNAQCHTALNYYEHQKVPTYQHHYKVNAGRSDRHKLHWLQSTSWAFCVSWPSNCSFLLPLFLLYYGYCSYHILVVMLMSLPPNKLIHSPCHYYKLQFNKEYGFLVVSNSYKIYSKSIQHFLTRRMQYIGRCADGQTNHPYISFPTHHTTVCNKMTKHGHGRLDMTIVGAEISMTTWKVYCITHLKLRFHTPTLSYTQLVVADVQLNYIQECYRSIIHSVTILMRIWT